MQDTFCKDADPVILKELEATDLLFAAPKFEHSYPLLLEMRYAADLLCEGILVYQNDGGKRSSDRQQ